MVATAPPIPLRGAMVDIGGRRLHMVCEGPRGAGPTVLFEAGAFGFSADWGVVQDKVAAQGLHSCSYDRAGLGRSDPGPQPRDGRAITADLEALLRAAHEPGPFILVGHSMAGAFMPLFAHRNPDKVAGLVFVDAVPPQALDDPTTPKLIKAFAASTRIAGWGGQAGLYHPLAGTWLGDKIGLTPAASAEKRRAFASPRHNKWAAAEVGQWLKTTQEARAAGPLDPHWPVAVVTAGPAGGRHGWKTIQAAPAQHAHRGYVEHVEAASHQNLLGIAHADAVVKAIDFVVDAARDRVAPARSLHG